ncbi:hypothetical protein [Rhizobium sp. K102]|jgi:hypothetical protein|uniref:hypothetical protein n=1 Tax=Rhizobium sp. K102 TaxID=2918527 RepID=UPI001EFBAD02|nr:hypothetical protein [Rhizobium sp. K102]ULR43916.1 hypothetical protein MHI61_22525 [Rhizobium sp. K102]
MQRRFSDPNGVTVSISPKIDHLRNIRLRRIVGARLSDVSEIGLEAVEPSVMTGSRISAFG